MNIPYKSFCWSLGTTSFRTKNFNKTIEEQLSLLNEFDSLKAWTNRKLLQITGFLSRYCLLLYDGVVLVFQIDFWRYKSCSIHLLIGLLWARSC